jgi:3-hydroxyanthranilate 3,4-dioxygenase
MLDKAMNFQKWIDDHRHLLKPPVCNKKVFAEDDFIVMVVGGPNARKDFHFEEGPEFFYQLEGEMVLHTIQNGKRVHIPMKAGDIFNLPPRIPHSPERMPNSVGLVVERKRRADEKDGLQWYCSTRSIFRWVISRPISRRCSTSSTDRRRTGRARNAATCWRRRSED